MGPEEFESAYNVAGRVSTAIKDTLKRLGVNSAAARRVAIMSYEA